MAKIRVVIDYQYQSVDKLVSIGINWLQLDRKGIDKKHNFGTHFVLTLTGEQYYLISL